MGSATSTTFVDAGLTPATSYSYRVRARDAAGNFSSYSGTSSSVTGSAPVVPPLAVLPAWANALAPGQWYEIPGTAMSSAPPQIVPVGNTGPQSKVIAWTSFVADPRSSMVYSVANGGHQDYSGNEVDRLELENDPPRWVEVLAPTPSAQVVANGTHYADGRPNSRHSYYGVTFNEINDRIMIFGGSRYSDGFGLGSVDSYNVSANAYSPAGTHPNVPASVTSLFGFAVAVQPTTADIFAFGNFETVRWSRATNSWATLAPSGPKPYGYGAMAAYDSARGRILILGGSQSDRHVYSLAGNAFQQIALTGTSANAVVNSIQGAMTYVAAIDRFLVRLGDAGGAVYQVHPSSFDVTLFASSASASIPAISNGPYNKFLYVPRLRGAVYVPAYFGNAWFLRVH